MIMSVEQYWNNIERINLLVGDEPILMPLRPKQSSRGLGLRSWRVTTSAMEWTLEIPFTLTYRRLISAPFSKGEPELIWFITSVKATANNTIG